ncbi:unnamed protein product [Spirodela intermedia]|uniref:Uncharacterized protein n=1 Tax=Spirodela intermedia TaxID=51605 RepID=A0A7I8K496_SPIIN|nr:unnamed protein product [Spirodela intermedia]
MERLLQLQPPPPPPPLHPNPPHPEGANMHPLTHFRLRNLHAPQGPPPPPAPPPEAQPPLKAPPPLPLMLSPQVISCS